MTKIAPVPWLNDKTNCSVRALWRVEDGGGGFRPRFRGRQPIACAEKCNRATKGTNIDTIEKPGKTWEGQWTLPCNNSTRCTVPGIQYTVVVATRQAYSLV